MHKGNDVKDATVTPAPESRHNGPPLAGIVKADTHVLDAALHILNFQFEVMCNNRARALTKDDPEFLHDFRVAARRFCVALRLFKSKLRHTQAHACGQRVRKLRRNLGTVRDAHVWLIFLERLSVKPSFAESTAFAAYLGACRQADVNQHAALRSLLCSDVAVATIDEITHLLEVEISDAVRNRASPPFGPFAAKRLDKRFRRILKTDARVKQMCPDAIHALRKRCRKARYYAEFSAGSLGKPVADLARRLKQVTTALGDIHDMDVRLQMLSSRDCEMPPIVVDAVNKHRRQALKRFEKAWCHLADNALNAKATKRLEEAAQAAIR